MPRKYLPSLDLLQFSFCIFLRVYNFGHELIFFHPVLVLFHLMIDNTSKSKDS
jgi:hypothetical protein